MDLKDLRFFIAVYEAKGFSRASGLLGTVQSNISARILSLERTLGAQLFERKWRSLAPTQNGDSLYAEATKVIAALNRAERAVYAMTATASPGPARTGFPSRSPDGAL